MERSFSKYIACGNDFILFDDREETFPFAEKALISRLCHRQFGVGADGIILLQRSSKATMKMRIFNADGSEAEMCGNGIRCLVKFASEIGLKGTSITVETMDNFVSVSESDRDITVEMGDKLAVNPFSLEWEGQKIHGHSVKAGVPHAVIFLDDIEAIDLTRLGAHIRHHSHFAPHGTNVNIAQRLPSGDIAVRTYERGIGETLACGTGAVAVGLAGTKQYEIPSPINIRPRSSEKMTIGFEIAGDHFSKVTLTGPAYCSFRGFLNLGLYR